MVDSRVTLRLIANVDGFRQAMEKLVRTVSEVMHRSGPIRRYLYGRRNLRPDGLWQSDLCAAWLHDSCPAPDLCDCRCKHPERTAA